MSAGVSFDIFRLTKIVFCKKEVYFYGGVNDFGSLPDVESITINDNTEYIMYGDYVAGFENNHHTLMPCTYRVSNLEQFGARFISAYKYNCY